MAKTSWIAAIVALSLTGCGGGDDDAIDDATTADASSETTASPTSDDADDLDDVEVVDGSDEPSADDEPLPTEGTSRVPIARFTAHGPQADNTIGPGCATGIDTRGGDVFRFTPPPEFAWGGTSGGTGSDRVEVRDADGVSLFVTESAYNYDTEVLADWQVIGPAGVDVEIDGATLPIMEVSLGGSPGYALVDVDYMSPMPMLQTEAALGTVAVTSSDPARPTLAEAELVLGSVRIERCAAVAEALIWGPADGTHLVPRFEPDPLGKTYPEQPQPAYVPGVSPLEAYSLDQLAYLMPVDAAVAACAAAAAREVGAGDPIAHLFMLAPTGTNKEQLDTIVAGC